MAARNNSPSVRTSHSLCQGFLPSDLARRPRTVQPVTITGISGHVRRNTHSWQRATIHRRSGPRTACAKDFSHPIWRAACCAACRNDSISDGLRMDEAAPFCRRCQLCLGTGACKDSSTPCISQQAGLPQLHHITRSSRPCCPMSHQSA